MKNNIRRAIMILLAAPMMSFAAKNSDEPSEISAYAGSYSGTVLLTGAGDIAPGTAEARFQASKKKENGTLTITSFFVIGSTPAVLISTYSINKRSFTYLLNVVSSTAIPASGSAKVGPKKISYTGFIALGGDSGLVTGKIGLTKKRLSITETIVVGPTTLTFTYSLKKNGGKK